MLVLNTNESYTEGSNEIKGTIEGYINNLLDSERISKLQKSTNQQRIHTYNDLVKKMYIKATSYFFKMRYKYLSIYMNKNSKFLSSIT